MGREKRRSSIKMKSLFVCLALFLLCEAGPCPPDPGWFQAGQSCYLVSTRAMNWYFGQEFCWGQGAYLAEIKSKEEEDLVDPHLITGVGYWLGLSDYATEGRYVWDESHEVAQYINWAPGQPDSNGGDHDCIFKTYDDPGWPAQGWYDGHCSWDHENYHGISKQIHALCEIDFCKCIV